MKTGFAFVALVRIPVLGAIVEHQLPGLTGNLLPALLKFSLLLTFGSLGLIGEIGGHFNLKDKFAGLLGKVGEIEVLVQPQANQPRNSQLDGLLRNRFHSTAAGILFPSRAGRSEAVISQPGVLFHIGPGDQSWRCTVDGVAVDRKQPGFMNNESMRRTEGNNARAVGRQNNPSLADIYRLSLGLDANKPLMVPFWNMHMFDTSGKAFWARYIHFFPVRACRTSHPICR